MADKTTQHIEDLLTMCTTTLVDVPLAGAKVGLGVGQDQEVLEAAWKGYDAWVRLTSASFDDLYRNPLFGNFMARSLDRWLRWQRLSQAMTGAFFAALWPAVGLPTAATVQALHEELSSLRIHLKTQDAAVHALAAQRNGNGTGHNETRPALPQKLTNGHAAKEGRKIALARALP